VTRPHVRQSRRASPGRWLAWHVVVADVRGVVRRSRYIKERWMWGGKSYHAIERAVTRKMRLVAFVLVVIGVLVFLGILALLQRVGMRMGGVEYTIPLVMMSLVVLSHRLVAARLAAERVLAGWTTQMRPDDPCLACGYPLTGAPTAADGCVECPECAAAWRIAQ
jgi:hypothetical protein